jgi:hypothetical protein
MRIQPYLPRYLGSTAVGTHPGARVLIFILVLVTSTKFSTTAVVYVDLYGRVHIKIASERSKCYVPSRVLNCTRKGRALLSARSSSALIAGSCSGRS